MDHLSRATGEELEAIPEIGPRTADSIMRFFQQDENQKVIEKLKAAGVAMASEIPPPSLQDTRFSGKTFVLTGTLENMPRHQAEEEIKRRGGKVSTSVSRKTNYVVVGQDPGSKYDKAIELQVNILTEKEFTDMLR